MQIQLADFGKKFNRKWIFKGINKNFYSNSITAIIGSNGSGKSSLLKLISGAEIGSQGKIKYAHSSGEPISPEDVYQNIHLVAPYTDLPELLSLEELYHFHNKFKPLESSLESFSKLLFLENDLNKQIRNFSSGMKQRLKLGLAFQGSQECLLLDEPCSNLDRKGIDLYKSLILANKGKRTIIIGSNQDPNEMGEAESVLNILDYK